MRHAAILAAILLSTTAALADDVPSPSVLGSGTSSQSVGVIGGAASASVDSGGSLDSSTGESGGHLTVSVDVLGNGASAGFTPPLTDEATEDHPADLPPASTAAATTASASASGDQLCDPVSGRALSIEQISALQPGDMPVVEACDANDLGRSERRALARNPALSRHLATSGFPMRDVTGLSLSTDGTTLLVSRAHERRAE